MPNLASRPCKVFFIEPTGRHARLLRLYIDANESGKDGFKCPGHSYHNASVHIGDFDGDSGIHIDWREYERDGRWPTHCEYCGTAFAELERAQKEHGSDINRQVFIDRIYRRQDGSQQAMFHHQWRNMAGAMWDQTWLHDIPHLLGPDGRSLCIVCPDGDHWQPDGPASNCALPGDKVHKCWVRHGDLDHLTVDKNGVTCAAGAGSIQTKHWHGYLRDGYLVDA